MTGFFIAFEGIDRCGKGTQASLVHRWLEDCGKPVELAPEPSNDTPIGKKIRAILEHREPAPEPFEFQRLFVIDRFQDIICSIRPALENGKIVLRDRFVLSTIAYGMLNYPCDQLLDLHSSVVGKKIMLWPNLTIILDISAETAFMRMRLAKEAPQFFEKVERLRQVRQNYLYLANRQFGNVVVISGELAPEQVFENIQKVVQAAIIEGSV